MTAISVKAVKLATVLVASLFLSGCVVLVRSQTDHMHRTLDHNLVEVKRSERILELAEKGDVEADESVIKFLRQYNEVIRNNTASLRKHIGEPPAEPEE